LARGKHRVIWREGKLSSVAIRIIQKVVLYEAEDVVEVEEGRR